jgi:phage shock protein E
MSEKLSLHEFFKISDKLQNGDCILDVRNPDEYAQGRIKNSLNIPLPELEARYNELQSFKKIYVHCKRGGRAKTASDLLDSKGFRNIVCVHDAGMELWEASGYPTAK